MRGRQRQPPDHERINWTPLTPVQIEPEYQHDTPPVERVILRERIERNLAWLEIK